MDACPDQVGAPSPDPKKNGCPGLVEIKGGQIVIKEQVFFATNKDVVLKKSFPLLDVVAHTMKILPQIRRLGVEGHTDNKGKPELNTALSDRRAKSVMQYLVGRGVAPERLQAQGFGPSRPIADNTTGKGRALNRRVDFLILDPPQVQAAPGTSAAPTAPTAPAAPAAPVVKPSTPVVTLSAKAVAEPPAAGKHAHQSRHEKAAKPPLAPTEPKAQGTSQTHDSKK